MTILESEEKVHGFDLKIKREYRVMKDSFEYTCYWHMFGKNLIRLDAEFGTELVEHLVGFNTDTFVPDELDQLYKHLIPDLQEILFVCIMANTNTGTLAVFNPIITAESLAEVNAKYNLQGSTT